MQRSISHLNQSRITCFNLIEGLTFEELNNIPSGFNNSILWNVGHLLVTQQLLHYKLSGLKMNVSDEIVDKFRKGSTAEKLYSREIWAEILSHFNKMPEQLEKDWSNGLFKTYTAYETSFGVKLDSIEDAISFNNIHEGMHFGYILALKRML